MRYLSVCSGMEAASVAWHPLGWQPAGFSEIEPFPCAILKQRFPQTPNYGSLTEYQTWPIEPGTIDLLVGGTPCQSFSVAGLRKGMADPRGNLALTFLGLADKVRPRWIVWENVPGVLSSNGGRDFGSFLGALVQLGYGFAFRILDAQYVGRCEMHPQGRGWDAVPQRRRRVFVVAYLGDWRPAASVLFEPESLRGDSSPSRKKGQGPAAGAESGVGADHSAGCWWDGGQVSQTLDAVLQKGQTMPEKNRFPAVLQPKPVVIDRAAFNQGQNAQYEPHIEESEVMDSLVARGPHAVGQPIPYRKSKRAQSDKDDETWVEGDVSNTLNNFDLGDTRTTHAVVEPGQVIPTLTSKMQGQSGWAPYNETAHILPVTDSTTHAVVGPGVYENHAQDSRVQGPLDVAPTVAAKYGTGGGNVPLVGAMAVRRLTPVECERLQGFPDNWSRIPWKGKPEEECPDGPRYKACGNSFAVPVVRWIGERIASVESILSQKK